MGDVQASTGSGQVALSPGRAQLGFAEPRQRMVLALDFDDSVVAMRWALRLRPWFGVAKVGMELFSASGPSVVTELLEAGFKVFADFKLADIPNTNRRAARVIGALGASYLTVHSFAPASLRAGVEGFAEGAENAGFAPPGVLAVTVLTSEPDAAEAVLSERAQVASQAGCAGVVCAAADLGVVRSSAPGLLTAVPGVRLAGAVGDDQARVATPAEAVRAGADLLVVGRAVTAHPDPETVAAAILSELST
ncbi:MAG: orotidine-5'-phosphate decarboxylase [Acidimicrobiales bacterium]